MIKKINKKIKKNNITNLNAIEIYKKLNIHKNELIKFKVEKIGLIGSYLKNQQNKNSDIDFIVSFKEKNFDNYMGLKLFLEKLFKKKIDLVLINNLRSEFSGIKDETKYLKIL
ncbi:MAG: nucleotidyltransferase domain-containing protein [Candidatus Woesearchaeota archaeon]